ncbi:MAG: flavodoxin family protein [ANME-2 cluster archaeon]|nr:flavodoxin family protein [ANME-2 cluster archaeon]
MKIVGISGSPNREGSNNHMIERSLDIAKQRGFDREKITLANANISPCTDCHVCRTQNSCPIEDDMAGINSSLESADGIIVSSPVYFGSPPGQLKMLFDRTLPLRRNGFLLKDKVGGALAVGASRNGGQEYTLLAIHAWMHIHGMIVVGDNSHFGGITQKAADTDEEGMKTVEDTVNKLCDTLDRLAAR